MFTPKRPSKLRKVALLLSVTAATALVVGSTTGATAMADGDPEAMAVAEILDDSAPETGDEVPAVELAPVVAEASADELAPVVAEVSADPLAPVAAEASADELAPVVAEAPVGAEAPVDTVPVIHQQDAPSAAVLTDAPAIAPLAQMPGAVFTTDQSGTQINGNIYPSKEAVYLRGHQLPEGSYFVRVIDPSGHSVLGASSGALVVVGADGTFGPVALYESVRFIDTPNSGREYKVELSSSNGFEAQFTQSDNFKVRRAADPAITVSKTVNTSWTRAYDWSVEKEVVSRAPQYTAGALVGEEVTYNVDATRLPQTADTYSVSGTITVTNTNNTPATINSVTDALPGWTCELDTAFVPAKLEGNSMTVDYSCDDQAFTTTPSKVVNTATAAYSWTGGSDSESGTAPVVFDDTPSNEIDETATLIDDKYDDVVDGENYTIMVPLTQDNCSVGFTNKASVTGDDSEKVLATDSETTKVVCPSDETTTTVPPSDETTTTVPPSGETATTALPSNETATTTPPKNETAIEPPTVTAAEPATTTVQVAEPGTGPETSTPSGVAAANGALPVTGGAAWAIGVVAAILTAAGVTFNRISRRHKSVTS